MTLALTLGFAVVGVAGSASAWDTTISGEVTCATGGGWAVTWTVYNSESETETITASSRPSAVPVGTTVDEDETRTFPETLTTKPTDDLTLTLEAEWDGGETSTDSGTIALASFSDDCAIKVVVAPTVPVIDDCGPGNAHYGAVPTGPWTSKLNADGSLTVTANTGYSFPGGKTSVTFPAPTDSNVPCPTPPVVTPPPAAPPVVAPPQVLPAEARATRGAARSIDKCGRSGDLFKVGQRKGVVYTSRGKVLREGMWLPAKTKSVVVRASAADATYRLEGKQVWRMKFTNRPCSQPPVVAPDTGA